MAATKNARTPVNPRVTKMKNQKHIMIGRVNSSLMPSPSSPPPGFPVAAPFCFFSSSRRAR